jgi:RNA polymerase sigma-70 factor (ECF subfamily)
MTTTTNMLSTNVDYEDTFADVYATYQNSLSAYALSKTNNKTLSEDLVQDTFTKTWKYLVRNGKVVSMRALLYHILRQLIIDEYRKHNKPTSLDNLLEKGFEPSKDDYERNFDISDGKRVAQLIYRLPEKYQIVIHMRYVQELPLKEMSLLTNQSPNTVAVQCHRGLEKLKTIYYQEQSQEQV